MHRHLREREVDALGIEAVVDFLAVLEQHIPVVCIIRPAAHDEVHRTVVQFAHPHRRLRILLYPFVGLDDLEQHLPRLLHILAVFHTDHPFYPARGRLREIHNGAATHGAVRHIDGLAVGRQQYRVENLYGLHRARRTLCLYPVPHLVRLQEQDDDTAGEVLQVATQGHTYSHAERCQQCRKARRVHTQCTHHCDNQQHLQEDSHEVADKRLHRDLHLPPFEEAGQQVIQQFYQVVPDDKQHYGDQDMLAGIQRPAHQLSHHLIPAHIAGCQLLCHLFHLRNSAQRVCHQFCRLKKLKHGSK